MYLHLCYKYDRTQIDTDFTAANRNVRIQGWVQQGYLVGGTVSSQKTFLCV